MNGIFDHKERRERREPKLGLLSLLFALFAFSAVNSSAQLVTATLTLTNTATINNPTNGYTLTVDGTTLTWTNLANSTAQYIANTNTIGNELTNLFNCLQLAGISGVQQVYYTGTNTNTLAIVGLNLTCSQAGASNWCLLTLNTNPITTNVWGVVVPFTSAYPVASDQTNTANQLVTGIDALATSVFGPYDIALSNYVALTSTNTISGPKTFTGATTLTNTGNYITGGTITNVTLQQVGGTESNVTSVNLVITNGQNFGNPFRSPGGGTGSEQFGLNASASTNFTVAIGDGAQALAPYGTAVGYLSLVLGQYGSAFGREAAANNPYDTSIGMESTAQGGHSTALGFGAQATATNSTALGYDSIANNPNSTVVGYLSSDTASNQVRLGTVSQNVSIPGGLEVDGGISNATVVGVLILKNKLLRLPYYNTGLANGNNSGISYSTNSVLYLSGPTAAFTNCGFIAGTNGQVLTVIWTNGAVAPMTLSNEDGNDNAPTNRIRIGSAGAGTGFVTTTNAPAIFDLWYDGTISRWLLRSANFKLP